jgi:hypothetical protein
MHGSRGLWGERRTIARLSALALAIALCFLLVAPAGGAPLIGKDGKVYACYKTKGKAKGSVRLVAKKAKCHRGFKKVAWNAVGQRGGAAENGEGGANGNNGEGGGQGAPGVTTLENRIATLTNKVNTLEGVLKGISNADLTGLLGKLQGVSGTQLQEAIKSVANVNALSTEVGSLCTQATKLTEQSNLLGGALGGTALGGLIPVGLKLLVPNLPAPLSAFGC